MKSHGMEAMQNMFKVGDKVKFGEKTGVINRTCCFKLRNSCSCEILYADETTQMFIGNQMMKITLLEAASASETH